MLEIKPRNLLKAPLLVGRNNMIKPLQFNLKDAQKIAGDKNSSTFHLKNGHKIMVAHNALPAEQRKALEKMPVIKMMADGGDTEPQPDSDQSQTPQLDALAQGIQATHPGMSYGDAVTQAALGQQQTSNNVAQDKQAAADQATKDAANDASHDAANLPKSPEEAQQQADALTAANSAPPTPITAPADTTVPAAAGDQVTTGTTPTNTGDNPPGQTPAPSGPDFSPSGVYNTGMAGINKQQQAETQIGQQQLAANQQYQQQLIDHDKVYQAGVAAKNDEINSVVEDIKNGHIDPNHYQENQTSGQKVANAIGLVLGGWSSAYTHQGNPAMDFLNKQIDRDIDSQKANLDQKKTLFGAYMDQTKNAQSAENMTRATLYGNYALQFQNAALKAATPLAQAKALQGEAAMKAKVAPLIIAAQQNQHLAAIQNASNNGQSGTGLDASIQSLINQKRMSGDEAGAKDLESKFVPGVGLASRAVDPKDSGMMTQYNSLDSDLNKAIQLQKKFGDTGAWTPQNRAQASQLKNSLIVRLSQLSGLNRVNEQEYKNYSEQVGNIGGVNMGGTLASLKGIQSQLRTEANAKYSSYNLKSPVAQTQYNPGDIIYVKNQKAQITDNQGNYKFVK
jgi:hypothetical protein